MSVIINGVNELQRELRRLSTGQLERIGKPVAEGLLSSTIQRFQEQKDPAGQPWKPLAPATISKRLGGKKAFTKKGQMRKSALRRVATMKILIDRAQLMKSIHWRVKGGQIALGTNLIYARIHQYGGPAGRGGKVNIDPRPFLGVSAEDQRLIEVTVARFLEGNL